jgi:hypothetical protein
MRTGTKITLFTLAAFAAGVGATLWLQHLYHAGGFFRDSWDAATRPPIGATKILIVITILVVFTALPIGIVEWRSERAFHRAQRELRMTRPADEVSRYDGPEGRGFLFAGPERRLLLLEPVGGMGEPRIVELPPKGEGDGEGEDARPPSSSPSPPPSPSP